MNLQQALASLRDIKGVTGSFIVGTSGQLVARDTPALLAEDILGPVAPRLIRLWDTLREVDPALDQAVISYESQKLYVRPVVEGLLCAIVPLGTNMPALRMAVNLLLKRINPRLLELQSEAGTPEPARDTSPSFVPYTAQTPRVSQPPIVTTHTPVTERESVPPEAEHGSSARYIVHRGRRYLA
jgi:predicted regulator of Ras-like GTPase activity (Roadblock/LC7/MglB family)